MALRMLVPIWMVIGLAISVNAGAQVTCTLALNSSTSFPGGYVQVTQTMEATQDLLGIAAQVVLPAGWTLSVDDPGGFTFNKILHTFLLLGVLAQGQTAVLIYTVHVPPAASEGAFSLQSTVSSALPPFSLPCGGQTQLVVQPQSLVLAICLDANEDNFLSTNEILQAVGLWLGGQTINCSGVPILINTDLMLALVAIWLGFCPGGAITCGPPLPPTAWPPT